MQTMLRHHKNDIYYESYFGNKRYWQQIGDKMYGWDPLSRTTLNHMHKPIKDFHFLNKQKREPGRDVIISPANRQIYNPAAEALECGS